jgi:hypothetical protein
VFIPEYVLGHWWEQLLHNQSALRLKARLLNLRGVVVASVPYQLKSATASQVRAHDPLAPQPGAQTPARTPGPRPSLRHRLTVGRDTLQAAEMRAEAAGISQECGTPAMPIADSRERDVVDVAGTLRAVTLRPRGSSLGMEAELWDGTGSITLVWLGRRSIPGIQPGRRLLVHGRLSSIKGEPTIFNPSYELQPTAGERG